MNSKKLKKFLALSFRGKLVFFEALVMLFFSKIFIFFIPLSRLAPHLGQLNGRLNNELPPDAIRKALQVKLFILMASANVPWRSVCLDQALAAMLMLKSRRVAHSLCLGVRKNEVKNNLDAHAWVLCGNRILVGGQRSNAYTIVATFSRSF